MRDIGDINLHNQKLTEKSERRGNHPFATIWTLTCLECGHVYGANSCDFHIRRCPAQHQGGKPGLPV